jgi:hypothetical protein
MLLFATFQTTLVDSNIVSGSTARKPEGRGFETRWGEI